MYIVSDGAPFVTSTLDRLLTKTTFVETEVTFVDKGHFDSTENLNVVDKKHPLVKTEVAFVLSTKVTKVAKTYISCQVIENVDWDTKYSLTGNSAQELYIWYIFEFVLW